MPNEVRDFQFLEHGVSWIYPDDEPENLLAESMNVKYIEEGMTGSGRVRKKDLITSQIA